MLSSRSADDLNSDLGRSAWSVSKKSASIFSRPSRDRAVGACCTEQGAAMDRFGVPPINIVSRGGGDPSPFVFFLSLPSPSSSFAPSDLATAVLPRPRAQLPPPAKLVLAPPLRVVRLWHMRINSLCHIRSTANPNPEMAAETACIPDPQATWVRSTMNEAKIQALVEQGLP
jgi:hypothetical protein